MSGSPSSKPPVSRPAASSGADPDFAMGGQAVLEGVMMRGPQAYAIAVRRPQGDIRMIKRHMVPLVRRKKWLRLPIVRGAVSLVEMMLVGLRALDYSANVVEQGLREQEAEKEAVAGSTPDGDPPASADSPAKTENAPASGLSDPSILSTLSTSSIPSASPEETPPPSPSPAEPVRAIGPWAMAGTFALSLVLAIALFVALPNVATHLLGMLPVFGPDDPAGAGGSALAPAASGSRLVEERQPMLYNLVAGAVRVLVLVGYIWGISFLKDIRRLFQYHGAEHKVVMAYEKKVPLDLEHVRPMTKVHPRCGTTFIAVVLFVSIVVFAILAALVVRVYPPFAQWSIWARKPFLIGLHVLFIPLVAGLGYEITRRAGKRPDFWLYNILLQPGYWFQRITTREPDDTMIEVALVAFNEVVEPRGSETAT